MPTKRASEWRRRCGVWPRVAMLNVAISALLLGASGTTTKLRASDGQAAQDDARRIVPAQVLSIRRPSLALPPAKQVQLKNGLQVAILDRGVLATIPLVHIQVRVRGAGDYGDPPDLPGLSRVTAALLQSGQSDAASRLSRMLAERAAKIAIASDHDGTTLSITGFREDARVLLQLASSLLVRPALQSTALPGAIRTARQMGEMPVGEPPPFGMQDVWLATRQIARAVQGAQWALARDTSALTEAKVSRERVLEFYRRYFAPDNAMIAISGLSEGETVDLLEETFGEWEGHGSAEQVSVSAPAKRDATSAIKVAPLSLRGGIAFTVVSCGVEMPRRFSEDHVVGLLADKLVALRLQELAKGELGALLPSHGGVTSNYVDDAMGGIWTVSLRLWKQESIARALRALRKEMAELGERTITGEELFAAKGRAIGALRLSPADAYITIWQYGLAKDYFDKAVVRVEATNAAQVQAFAKRYWDASRIETVIVGSGVDTEALRALGPISVVGSGR